MGLIVGVLSTLIWLFLLLLIARMIIGLIMVFARDFQPTGALVIIFEFVMSVTDPPLKALRRIIPPLRIGQVSLDLAFLVLFIGLQLLLRVLAGLGMRSTSRHGGSVMALSSQDVHDKQFKLVRNSTGYDMDEVDAFLDEVEAEIARLTDELEAAQERLAAAIGGARGGDQPRLPRLASWRWPSAPPTSTWPTPGARPTRWSAMPRRPRASRSRSSRRSAADLEARVTALRTFESEIRSRLTGYFQSQLADLRALADEGTGGRSPADRAPSARDPRAPELIGGPLARASAVRSRARPAGRAAPRPPRPRRRPVIVGDSQGPGTQREFDALCGGRGSPWRPRARVALAPGAGTRLSGCLVQGAPEALDETQAERVASHRGGDRPRRSALRWAVGGAPPLPRAHMVLGAGQHHGARGREHRLDPVEVRGHPSPGRRSIRGRCRRAPTMHAAMATIRADQELVQGSAGLADRQHPVRGAVGMCVGAHRCHGHVDAVALGQDQGGLGQVGLRPPSALAVDSALASSAATRRTCSSGGASSSTSSGTASIGANRCRRSSEAPGPMCRA